MSAKPALKESLFILKICGINPIKQNIWSTVNVAVLTGLLIYIIVEEFLQFAFNWKGWESVDEFIVYAGYMQVISKIVFMILKRRDITLVLNKVEQFKYGDNLPLDIHRKLKRICEYTVKSIKLFGLSCCLTAIAYLLKPLLTLPIRTLPFDVYHPIDRNLSPDYEIMYIMQAYSVAIGCLCVVGFDSFFISLVIHIICELKVLKQKFSDVKVTDEVLGDERRCLDEISGLINHHNFILGIITNMDKLYSVFLLNQFSNGLICVCSGLLSIAASDFPSDLERIVKGLTCLAAGLSQLLLYCAVGENLITESESLSGAVFESGWWVKTQPKLRKSYVMVIQRAQKTVKLSAGGMFALDLQTFTSIMRLALSFFTMAQAMYTRHDKRATGYY